MTELEAQAKDYAMSRKLNLSEPTDITHVIELIEKAYISGSKGQWHDLRKNPADLPPKMVSNHNFSIEVLSDKGELVCYNFHYCEWFYWRSGEPIAWCELPTFDTEYIR